MYARPQARSASKACFRDDPSKQRLKVIDIDLDGVRAWLMLTLLFISSLALALRLARFPPDSLTPYHCELVHGSLTLFSWLTSLEPNSKHFRFVKDRVASRD